MKGESREIKGRKSTGGGRTWYGKLEPLGGGGGGGGGGWWVNVVREAGDSDPPPPPPFSFNFLLSRTTQQLKT